MGTQILYDEEIGRRRITVEAPAEIPRASLLPLLESALRMSGFVLVEAEVEDWYRIENAEKLTRISRRPEGEPGDTSALGAPVTEVFSLEHVSPDQVTQVLENFLSEPGGNALPVQGTSLLIVTEFPSNLERVRGLLELLDEKRREVEIAEVTLEHVRVGDVLPKLRSLIESARRAEGTPDVSGSVELLDDPRTNKILVLATSEEVELVRKLTALVDQEIEVRTEIYRLGGATPGSVSRLDELLRGLLGEEAPERYSSSVDEELGLLVVTAPPEIHERIESILEGFEAEPENTRRRVEFYRLRNAKAADVLQTIRELKGSESSIAYASAAQGGAAPDAFQPRNAPATSTAPRLPGSEAPLVDAAPPVPEGAAARTSDPATPPAVFADDARVVADPSTNTIIVIGTDDAQASYKDLIERLDVRRPQVLIELILVTLDTSESFSLGVEISGVLDGDPERVLTFSSFGLSEIDPDTGALSLSGGPGFNGAVLSSDIADAVVRALATSARAKVLSAPRILVNDNATGTLNSVQDAPYVSVNASNTVSTTSFGGFENAGTRISVTPHIAEGEHLHLEYSITLSTFTGSSGDGIPPPRQRNEVDSEVTVPDGSTVVVGGLTRSDWGETVTKIPILGDIPLLRYLFQSRSLNESTSTLFLFIRPAILRDDRFEDLKYYSRSDLSEAGLEPDAPVSAPLILR